MNAPDLYPGAFLFLKAVRVKLGRRVEPRIANMSTTQTRLPWWTWLATLVILHTGSQISLIFKYDQGVTDYYVPTALSLILINWWGPARVLPIMYLNAALSTYLWGIPVDRWHHWFVYAIPETLFTFLAWYLFRKIYDGKYWLPDIRNTVAFLLLGILIPIIPEIFLLQSLLVWIGDQPIDTYWIYITRNWLGEFTSSFGLVLPVLYYLTPVMQKSGLLYDPPKKPITTPPLLQRKGWMELLITFSILFGLIFVIEFEKFWYIYGLVALYTAMRFGFGPATITNYYIFLLIYILPKFFAVMGFTPVVDRPEITNIFLGISLLFVFAALTGRVMSDVRIAEVKLQRKNRELDQTNRELDRFVYSVSHDLSAPLKSILGLVNISRITKEPTDHIQYLSRIETSVVRLEAFIAEILDYSKNKRQKIVAEQVKLKELCHEILDNLRYMEEFSRITVDMKDLEYSELIQDKMRLKIILNNLLTNAVKFQKRIPDHQPYIKVSSRKHGEVVLIDIEDNGEGIRDEMQSRIFDMFYRGTENAKGSGLGLYIAREAAARIQGTIYVRSEYGKGSIFTVELRNLN
jgi:signal transduction histidine kinase